ncbi:MAG: HEAT repeat domain-containing protein [Deltaproteobacteria bacterium]|nr:HEAT repeat domain-containing protein [Deltaproteobacteria bacterium]
MDLHSKAKRARVFLERGRYSEAAAIYRELVAETHTIEPDYDSWLRGMAEALSCSDRRVEAVYCYLYLQHYDEALALLEPRQAIHRARVLEQRGEQGQAAAIYGQEGKLVLAAVGFEREAEQLRETRPELALERYGDARRAWMQLREDSRMQGRLYEQALVCFNLGACCLRLGDETGNGHLVSAQRLLEEAADSFETQGKRERAFDCYQILLELGRRSGAFENLAEGFINCIRILKEDNLKYYALQYYEDFLREAMQRGELHAAASLYREAADYCRRVGLIYHGYYLKSAADTWLLAARKTLERGGSAEMAENGFLAAVDCFNAVGDYQSVGGAYLALSELEIGERRQERYMRIAARYEGRTESWNAQVQAFPEYLRQPHAYPEIWYMDVVEWEHDGDPAAVCAAVIGETRYPQPVRRRALNVMLSLLEGHGAEAAGLAHIAEALGDMQIYPVLSPLERLFEHPDARVQRGVMRALRFLFFKRAFNVLGRGLVAEDYLVRQGAVEALGRLHFNHAFDPLVRIFRESTDIQVRTTALESLGRIPSLEAGDFLVEVIRQEGDPLRGTAKRLLTSFENRDFFPILRQQYELESEDVRADLAEVLRLVGIHVEA